MVYGILKRCNCGTFRPDVSLASNRLLATHRRPDRPNLELQIMIRITAQVTLEHNFVTNETESFIRAV